MQVKNEKICKDVFEDSDGLEDIIKKCILKIVYL